MRFLEWLKHRRAKRVQVQHLFDRSHWWITGLHDFVPFFAELPELVPAGSLLGLADGTGSPDLETFYTLHSVPCGAHETSSLPAEFRHAPFVAITETTMSYLANLANEHAEPEIAIHVVAVRAGESVLEWFDAPDDPFSVAQFIDEDRVRDFCSRTEAGYAAVEHGV